MQPTLTQTLTLTHTHNLQTYEAFKQGHNIHTCKTVEMWKMNTTKLTATEDAMSVSKVTNKSKLVIMCKQHIRSSPTGQTSGLH